MVTDQRIAKEAGAFYEVGKNCYNEICRMEINQDNAYLIMPCAMNLTFSAELFLKACIEKGTRGHKLAELFDLVSESEKDAIVQITIKKYIAETKQQLFEEEFWERLNAMQDAFVEWRYFYEQKHSLHLEIAFLLAFVSTLHFICEAVMENAKRRQKAE